MKKINLILIHGLNESMEIFEKIIPFINKNIQVWTIDLPGFGNQNHLCFFDTIDDSNPWLENYIISNAIDNPFIIGHSLGGYIALSFANYCQNKNKLLISGFGLLHSTCKSDTEERKKIRLKTIDHLLHNHPSDYFKLFTNHLFNSQKKPESLIEYVLNIVTKTNKNSTIEALKAIMDRKDYSDFFEKTTFPTCIIAGKYDSLIPYKSLVEISSTLKNNRFYLLENSGHLGMVEEPAHCASLINAYFNL